MRSIRMLAALTGTLTLASACGGDGGTPPSDNLPPVAIFTAPSCTVGVACAFTADPSTDDAAVTGWAWDFNGDLAAPEATTKDASFSFPAAGTAPVRLIVTDAEGLADTVSHDVTVTAAPPANVAPNASFDLPTGCTAGTPCGFQSTSTDPNGDATIATWHWEFGAPDLGTADGANITHTFAAAGTYSVKLTVTDNGGLTDEATEQLIVAPAAIQDCTTTGTVVDCSLTMTARSTVTFTMVSRACELNANRVVASAPANPTFQTVFNNLCNRTPGETYTMLDSGGLPLVLESGTVLAVQFRQGTEDPGDPAKGDPGVRVTGSAPTWTLNIDDGGAAGTAGEPDFNDAIITVQANAAP